MRTKRCGVVLLAVLMLLPLWIGQARAEWNLRGDSRTVLESYDDPVSGEASLPFYEYIRLRLDDSAEGVQQKIRLYGRFATDLADEADVPSRLYYAWYERKRALGEADLKAGRFWVNTVAGSPIIDGIDLSVGWKKVLRAEIFGGGYVTLEDDGTDDAAWGFSVSDDLWKDTDLTVSYLQKLVDGDLARELLGMSAWRRLTGSGSAYGELQYDLLSQIASYYAAGVRLAPAGRLTLRADYLGFTPVFDSTSIYSVFAVDEYQEFSVKADYRMKNRLILFGGYTREIYTSFDDADVVQAGVERISPDGIGGYVAGIYRSGDEELKGIKASVRAPVPYGVRLDAGLEHNVYTRVDDEKDGDTSASRYWVEGKKEVGRDLTLQARIERIQSVVYDYYHRGRFSLRYRF